jgi:L-cysteine desulfidase
MERERTERAVARIEAALARLEAASRATSALALAEANGRHERLRAAVTDALGQLDAMIGGARS